MVTQEDAATATRAMLAASFGDELRTADGDEVVVQVDRITEYDEAWLVPFNSRAFIEDGDMEAVLIPSAYLVPKDPSIEPHIPPTYLPVEEYLAEIKAGKRHWPKRD